MKNPVAPIRFVETPQFREWAGLHGYAMPTTTEESEEMTVDFLEEGLSLIEDTRRARAVAEWPHTMAGPGEIIVSWGVIPEESIEPQTCYSWGDTVCRSDKFLLHQACTLGIGSPGLFKQLIQRGYDPRSLRIYAKKLGKESPSE